MRLEGVTVSQADIGAHLAVSWLTPQMNGIFLDSPVARRRFLDRLVIAFDPAHIGVCHDMKRLSSAVTSVGVNSVVMMRGLVRLSQFLAETAVAVTAARQSLIKALNDEAAKGWFGFPGVKFAAGWRSGGLVIPNASTGG